MPLPDHLHVEADPNNRIHAINRGGAPFTPHQQVALLAAFTDYLSAGTLTDLRRVAGGSELGAAFVGPSSAYVDVLPADVATVTAAIEGAIA